MTHDAVHALEADRGRLLEICAELGDADWKAESGCAGWSVQDVVAHMGALFWMVVDPNALPDTGGLPTERAQDVFVESRRSWTAAQVVEDYAMVSAKALTSLADLEAADFEIPLGDLGTYPASLVPNAFVFDHYTHIRADLFPPRGPLSGDIPPSDHMPAVLDWIEAALPQQNVVPEIALDVTGERSMVFGSPIATIASDAPALVRWISQRGTWEDLGVVASGDPVAVAAARELHVY
jgi:uncharacterized protein (TIGR03083 family)